MYQVKICFRNTAGEDEKVKELFDVQHFNQLIITRDNDATVYHAVLKTDKEFSSRRLTDILAENPFILSVERCDDD